MSRVLDKAYGGLTKLLPAAAAGRLDLLRPSYASAFGGPLNGQERRRASVRALARAIEFDRVIETGTYRGTSTEFFAAVFDAPIETVEANRRFFAYSRRRLAVLPQVTVRFGDSRSFLRELSSQSKGETVFIYLDAHWEEDLPLREEIRIIGAAWRRAVVMIDDFMVPGDPGYTYDDYGPGKALVEDYLPPAPGWALLYPTAPSSDETGAKRGSCLLASPELVDVVNMREFRFASTL